MVRAMQMTEKRSSLFKEFAEGVIDRHTVNFWLQKLNPVWSVHQALGKIVQIHQAAADTVSLTLQTNRHFQAGRAGQHHPVFVSIEGVRYERNYSLTQLDAHHVLLTVKKTEKGKVSHWLTEQAKTGDILEFGQPYGDMTLQQAGTDSVLLLAAGSGITPMYSLLNDLHQKKQLSQKKIKLLYWVKHYADVAFKQQFEQWAEQYSDFSCEFFYTQEGDSRINETHHAAAGDMQSGTVFACGPSGFSAEVEKLFTHAARLKTESFSLSQFDGGETGFVNVTLTRSDRTVAIPKGQSILVGLEQQNIKPAHGCRMGVCHKCVCSKVQGTTQDMANGKHHHEPGSALKICVNSAQTDLVIDL